MLLNLRYQLDVCVGANTVRPSKKQTHGNNKVRQQKILPDNPEFTANLEHGRTVFARRSNKPTATTRFGSKKILPDNSEFTANPEHGRTVFARRRNKPTVTTRFGSKKFSPTILNLQQILSTGERCSPLQIVRASFTAAKSLRSVLVHISVQLCPFLTPHLIPLPSCILPHFRL